jgi:hypothetical protein
MHAPDKVQAAAQLMRLSFPPSLPVSRIEVEDYTDSTGEPALRVLVVLKESAHIEGVTGEDVGELKTAIRDRLQEIGFDLFAYIFLAKPSELVQTADEA